MFKKIAVVIAGILFLFPFAVQAQPEAVVLQRVFPRLSFSQPNFIAEAPDGSGRLFVAEQRGTIKVFPRSSDPAPNQVSTFLDISANVLNSGEQGLLGVAFDPNYAANGRIYVHYSWDITNPSTTRLSRFTNDNPADNSVSSATEEPLFTLPQPYSNHNGGWIGFGPDQMIYFALGDGGSAGDPQNRAQNLTSFFGKILRLDVKGTPDAGLAYRIPPDNPYYNDPTAGIKKEIWAWGFRNPWRCGFDSQTGILYGGDVGQGAWEEVDVITRGDNYGWRLMEGNHPYNLPNGTDTSSLIPPIAEYGHTSGNISITGGYVYHGMQIPTLQGMYVYGDYGSGRVWALRYDGTAVTSGPHVLIDSSSLGLSSFGQDSTGDIYLCDRDTGTIHTLWPETVGVDLNLEINGQHPPTNYVITSGPVQLTLDVVPHGFVQPLDWYFAYIVNGKVFWVTSMGVSTSPAPLLNAPPVNVQNLPLLSQNLPPGNITFVFLLANGSSIVSQNYITAVIQGAAQ